MFGAQTSLVFNQPRLSILAAAINDMLHKIMTHLGLNFALIYSKFGDSLKSGIWIFDSTEPGGNNFASFWSVHCKNCGKGKIKRIVSCSL